MKNFIIPVIFNFEGNATVKATSKDEAIEIINRHLRARLGEVSSDGQQEKIVDWDIDLAGYPEILEQAIEEAPKPIKYETFKRRERKLAKEYDYAHREHIEYLF